MGQDEEGLRLGQDEEGGERPDFFRFKIENSLNHLPSLLEQYAWDRMRRSEVDEDEHAAYPRLFTLGQLKRGSSAQWERMN